MKRIVLSILILNLATFAIDCQRGNKQDETESAIPVQVEPVRSAQLAQPVRTSGRLSSAAEIKLSFKIGGIIDAFSVREGEEVQKGQMLASLKLDEIEGQVEQVRAGFEKAQRDFKRVQQLYGDEVVTLEQVQNAESSLRVAQSNLKIAEFNLDHAVITAPSKGRILKQLAEAGELTGPGYPVLYFGNESGRWVIKTGVAEQDLIRLALGDSASVQFDAYPGIHFPASVSEIAAGPDPQNGLYEVELELDALQERVFSGFVASVDIYPSRTQNVFVVPFSSLVNVSGLHGYVYRIDDADLAVKVPVEIAYFLEEDAIIHKGLEDVATVVTEGAAYLNGKTKVKIVDHQ
ncbi:efflux RND transporter periplasmic adaptor subunit [candidate division KSB1 bacterium]|nr:efflux RND transporter periplasmic adaptor subunit [candidate division KSB1 bacterium]